MKFMMKAKEARTIMSEYVVIVCYSYSISIINSQTIHIVYNRTL